MMLESALHTVATSTQAYLGHYFQNIPDNQLRQAIRHSVLAPGKAFRAYLVSASSALYGIDSKTAQPVGAAVEMLHAYSLIHDDLPAMDDSPTRRGLPSCHVAFDEATAILAGDALLTESISLLSRLNAPADVRLTLINGLTHAAGQYGMVHGQMLDLQAEASTLEEIETLQSRKTGDIIAFAAEAGAILGEAPERERQALQDYGHALGLVFQIRDDLLDEEADAATLGKPVHADHHKVTFTKLLGIHGAKAHGKQWLLSAEEALLPFGDRSDSLKKAAQFAWNRAL